MDNKITIQEHDDILIAFRKLSAGIIDKYCAMRLPYKPGLYSIYWESMYRLTGLLNELNAAADKLWQVHKSEVLAKQLDDIIHLGLLRYVEKIYGTEYADIEQPQWMIQIARRLQLYTPLRSNA
ncbi:MAG: hypothetical protein BGO69_16435 [Bacteroidetes bacterium 46-16]|nr:MAG: hypothetical protein BGO69_16435 [Bacteroidetes bacterium 46-16]